MQSLSEEVCLDIYKTVLGVVKGTALFKTGEQIADTGERLDWHNRIIYSMRRGDSKILSQSVLYRTKPVDIKTFIVDKTYLDKGGVIYPVVVEALEELNSGAYIEAVLTGGIGSAKTTIALYTIAYQLYILSCLRNPHAMFNLDPASEILFIFQSLHGGLAKDVEFKRFKSLVESSYYFTQVFPFKKDIHSRLIFPNRIEVVPISGEEAAAIGQNVIGGIIDEVNYMAIIEASKKKHDGGGYDQAWALYNSIARRRKSRFIVEGKTYGMLCLASSKRFPGQFTDIKTNESMAQIATTGKTNIFVYDKRVWDVKPVGTFKEDEFFPVFIGDQNRQPKVITKEEAGKFSEEDKRLFIIWVPGDYKAEFHRDIINALREIAGVSTLAAQPFLSLVDKVSACFGKSNSVLSLDSVVIGVDKLKIVKANFKNLKEPRYAHIDLSLSGDSTGLAIGHVSGFKDFMRGKGTIEILPHIVMDCTLEIKPPPFGEIEYSKVRNIIYALKQAGLPIKWVSFDSYQSTDSMQIFRSKGYGTGLVSMDKTMVPYTFLKAALYDNRVAIPNHERLFIELKSLEYDSKKGKVDHTSVSTKDVSDALCGVVYGLTMRRETWISHGIPLKAIPESIQIEAVKVAMKESEKTESKES